MTHRRLDHLSGRPCCDKRRSAVENAAKEVTSDHGSLGSRKHLKSGRRPDIRPEYTSRMCQLPRGGASLMAPGALVGRRDRGKRKEAELRAPDQVTGEANLP